MLASISALILAGTVAAHVVFFFNSFSVRGRRDNNIQTLSLLEQVRDELVGLDIFRRLSAYILWYHRLR